MNATNVVLSFSQFACYCEPNNDALQKRLEWAKAQGSIHAGQRGTVPSTIADEKKHNPFAKIDNLAIMEFCGPCDDRNERMTGNKEEHTNQLAQINLIS